MAEDFDLYVVNSINIYFMIRHSLKIFPAQDHVNIHLYLLVVILYMYFKPLIHLKFVLGGGVN